MRFHYPPVRPQHQSPAENRRDAITTRVRERNRVRRHKIVLASLAGGSIATAVAVEIYALAVRETGSRQTLSSVAAVTVAGLALVLFALAIYLAAGGDPSAKHSGAGSGQTGPSVRGDTVSTRSRTRLGTDGAGSSGGGDVGTDKRAR